MLPPHSRSRPAPAAPLCRKAPLPRGALIDHELPEQALQFCEAAATQASAPTVEIPGPRKPASERSHRRLCRPPHTAHARAREGLGASRYSILDSALQDPEVRARLLSSFRGKRGDQEVASSDPLRPRPSPRPSPFTPRLSQIAIFASGCAAAALALLWVYPYFEDRSGPSLSTQLERYAQADTERAAAVYRGESGLADSGSAEQYRLEAQHFHWPDFAPGARYKVLIYDRSFNKIATLEVKGQLHLPIPAELWDKLRQAKSFYWLVEAYHADGKKSESHSLFEQLSVKP